MSVTCSSPRQRAGSLILFAAILSIFFFSGSCGLIYQVVWTRKLVLLFGTTAYAVSTVLSIFFVGLAVGSLWGGRLADRVARPLFLYGFFEIAIGLWAVLFLAAVTYGETLAVNLLSAMHFGRTAGIGVRAALAFILLFIPVALMGATLPLLAKCVNREIQVRGLRIGALYTVNTFGAVAGCFAAGFLLLPALGYACTTLVGAAVNGIVGCIAIGAAMISKSDPGFDQGRDLAEAQAAGSISDQPALHGFYWVTLAAYGISGCAALALEVLWTRLLTIVLLGTTYAYTTMLTTLLCGLAVGGLISSLIVDRARARGVLLGAVMMLTGILCVAMLNRFAALPDLLTAWNLESNLEWNRIVYGKFLLAFSVLFAPTLCFGMTFPIMVKTLSALRDTLGRDIGRLYSMNTLGGVIGAVAGGFVLIPWLGAQYSILVIAATLCLTGALLIVLAPGMRSGKKAMLLAIGVALFAFAWMRAPRDISEALNVAYIPQDHQVLSYREGVEGTVAVSEPVGETGGTNRVLWINRVQATTSIEKGVKMNRFQGVLPLLFDRDPRRVLFMCFGSGITCGTLALYDFDRIDAVEISPDVIAVAPLFAADNLNVLDRPNLSVHIDDGRNFLLTSREQYDIITFEPMPLALAGVSTFYSHEYYELCLKRLSPGGMVSQWVPMHSLSPDIVRSLVHTFTEVFPEYCAWFINADLFLIGSNQPLRIDYPRLSERLARPEIKAALEKTGLRDPEEVVACFLMDKQALAAYAQSGERMTDDQPWAEFIAPQLVYQRTVQDTIVQVQLHVTSPLNMLTPETPADVAAAIERRHQAHRSDLNGLITYYGGLSIGDDARKAFRQSLDIDPNDYNAQYYLKEIIMVQGEQMLRWEKFDEGINILIDSQKYLPEDPDLRQLLERTFAAQSASK